MAESFYPPVLLTPFFKFCLSIPYPWSFCCLDSLAEFVRLGQRHYKMPLSWFICARFIYIMYAFYLHEKGKCSRACCFFVIIFFWYLYYFHGFSCNQVAVNLNPTGSNLTTQVPDTRNTSATQTTPVWYKCNANNTSATQVRHKQHESKTSATRMTWVQHKSKILILITTQMKTYFHTPILAIY